MEDRLQTITPRNRALYLKTLPFARDLNADALMMVALQMRERTFQSGEILLRQDEPIDGVFILTSGSVELSQDGDVVGHLQAPGRVGLIGLLAGPRQSGRDGAPGDIVADSAVEALEIPADVLSYLLGANFKFLFSLTRWIARQLLEQRPETLLGSACGQLSSGSDSYGLFDRLQWLHQSRVFEHANLEAVLELARHQEVFWVEQAEALWQAGEQANQIFSLVDGCVELGAEASDRGGGEPNPSERIDGPEFLGLLESLGGRAHAETAHATESVVVLRLEFDVFLDVLEDHVEMAKEVMRTLAASAVERRWSDCYSDQAARADLASESPSPSALNFGFYSTTK